jgi:hypothetical protein
MSPTVKSRQLLDRLVEIVQVVYSEPDPPIILGSILFDDVEVAVTLNEPDSMKAIGEKKKRKKAKQPKSLDIRDMFRRKSDKKQRKEGENTEAIVID